MKGLTRGRCRGLAWIVLALIATGCASNKGPLANAKVLQAERAFGEAQQNGASLTAARELKAAEDKLKEAQTAMRKKDYDQAIRAAEQAAVDADYARTVASNERVKKAADEMRKNVQMLRQELGRRQ